MVQGGVPPMRPDQALQGLSRAGTGPAPQSVIFVGRLVIVSGVNGGQFVYNAARTQLESSSTGAATTDPVLGIPVPQGFATFNSFGKVINLLSTANNAFFQYASSGATQGVLILAVSSVAGTDPVTGAAYPAGLYGVDPFGNFTNVVGSGIAFATLAFTRSAGSQVLNPSNAAHQPNWKLDAPEDTTASHAELELFGASPDGTTKPAQAVLSVQSGNTIGAPVTNALWEVQGTTALANEAAPAAVAGYVQPYAGAGELQYVDAAGGIYSTGESRQFSTVSQLINSTSLVPVKNLAGGNLAVGVASGEGYIIRAHLVMSTTSAAGQPQFAFQTAAGLGSPNTAIVKFFQAGAVTSTAGGSTNTFNGPVLVAADFIILDLEAEVTFSSAGTFTLEAATTNAADTYTIVGGHMTSKPITN